MAFSLSALGKVEAKGMKEGRNQYTGVYRGLNGMERWDDTITDLLALAR